MEFLSKSVLPQSAHHMILLKYLIVVAFVIVIPYLSLLLGNMLCSLNFRGKAIKEKKEFYYRFSEDLIEMITFNKSSAFAFGIVPLLSVMFGYMQLLNHTTSSVGSYIFVAVILLVNAQLLIYSYKKGFYFKPYQDNADTSKLSDEEKRKSKKKQKAVMMFGRSGVYGLILLLLSIYIMCFGIYLASDSTQWENINSIWDVVFSLNPFIIFLQFFMIAILISSSLIFYRFFRNNSSVSNYSHDEKKYIKNLLLKRGLVAVILLPLFIVLSVMLRSKLSLSFNVFGYTVLALFLILLVGTLLYAMIKEDNTRFAASVLYLIFTAIFVLVIRDQYSFDVSSKKQFALLAADYVTYETGIKEKLGIGLPAVNGADIYNGRCIACHNFDKKVVGPPYNQTMPKYEGKKDQLVKFILNPVKVNPDYPAMPNQGLKPNEAEAVAEFLLSTYKKK